MNLLFPFLSWLLREGGPARLSGASSGLALVVPLFLQCSTAAAQPELRPVPVLLSDSVGLYYRARWAPAPDPRRVRLVALGIGSGSAAVISGLGATWYTGQKSSFHWFNDAHEWAQLDKVGHVWGAFQESRAAVDRLRWAGLSRRDALLWGAPVGLVLQGAIEYFDGRSPGYGASATDLAANAVGTALFAGQVALWDHPRLWPKMGVHLTPFAKRRPNTLGANVPARLLKDYNGQTHWLTADIGAFLGSGTRWPRWLQIAVGYGAENLVYGAPEQNRAAGFRTVRQFYLGPDVHLMNVRTRSKVLRRLFYVLSIVRLPAPALEVRSTGGGIRLHGLYF
ncbi:MAG: DUF2279 domain-containing protein [Hymenobacteraceae bacterium]|nr:DUF2279 domain-containing protein [Hymenobacteraceae bacterium]